MDLSIFPWQKDWNLAICLIFAIMVASNSKEACKSKNWSLVFTGNSGSTRHPSSRQQTIEVCENFLHVKKANYEPLPNADGIFLLYNIIVEILINRPYSS